jgi:hypothetical protein
MESHLIERLDAVEARMEALEARTVSEQRSKFALIQSIEDRADQRQVET